MSFTYGHVAKLFLESKFQHKANKQTKKTQILSKILLVSSQKQIQNMKLFKYNTKQGQKKIWTKLSSLGQEPTFKANCWRRTPQDWWPTLANGNSSLWAYGSGELKKM